MPLVKEWLRKATPSQENSDVSPLERLSAVTLSINELNVIRALRVGAPRFALSRASSITIQTTQAAESVATAVGVLLIAFFSPRRHIAAQARQRPGTLPSRTPAPLQC